MKQRRFSTKDYYIKFVGCDLWGKTADFFFFYPVRLSNYLTCILFFQHIASMLGQLAKFCFGRISKTNLPSSQSVWLHYWDVNESNQSISTGQWWDFLILTSQRDPDERCMFSLHAELLNRNGFCHQRLFSHYMKNVIAYILTSLSGYIQLAKLSFASCAYTNKMWFIIIFFFNWFSLCNVCLIQRAAVCVAFDLRSSVSLNLFVRFYKIKMNKAGICIYLFFCSLEAWECILFQENWRCLFLSQDSRFISFQLWFQPSEYNQHPSARHLLTGGQEGNRKWHILRQRFNLTLQEPYNEKHEKNKSSTLLIFFYRIIYYGYVFSLFLLYCQQKNRQFIYKHFNPETLVSHHFSYLESQLFYM